MIKKSLNTLNKDVTIGELVADNYSVSAIFDSFGIDYSCKGNRTIEEVCEDRDIDAFVLIDGIKITLNMN